MTPQIIVPSHIHSASPDFVAKLEGQRIFFDAGTLLRAILFKESHSRRIIEHLQRAKNGNAVTCSHVKNTALEVIGKHYPALKEKFIAGYLALIAQKILEITPDGDIATLPSEAAKYDPDDDSVVLASAISARCSQLATLDIGFAKIASELITVLPPSEPEYSAMAKVQTQIPKLFLGSEQGSLLMLVRPSEGSTNYTKPGGRRYVFVSEQGLACWLNEESWHYEIGNPNKDKPMFTFTDRTDGEEVFIGLSFNLPQGEIWAALSTNAGKTEVKKISAKRFPKSAGKHWGILSNGEHGSFSGYWRGALSSKQFVPHSGLKYAVKHKSFFIPMDAQRFPLSDAVVDRSLVLVPEKIPGARQNCYLPCRD